MANNEIELYSRMQNPLEAIDRIGEMFARSGMFGCERTEQGKILAMICLAERKSPVQITRDYDIVEGKLRKKALAALADFRALGGTHKWLKSGDEPAEKEADRSAKLRLTYKGEIVEYEYSMADARTEGLIRDKSRWVKRPGNMLRARCISNGLGMLCPEIFAGDDGIEDEPAPAALNLAQPQEAPKAEPKPAKVVDVQVVAEPPKQQTAQPPAGNPQAPTTAPTSQSSSAGSTAAANTQPQSAAQAEFPKGPSYAPNGNKLPDDLVAQVEQAIGEHGPAAVAWMVREGWIAKGKGLDTLTESRAKRIIKNRDSFIRAINEAKA